MASIATTFLRVRPDTSEVRPGITKDAQAAGKTAGGKAAGGFRGAFVSGLKGVVAPLAALFGAREIGRFFKGAVDEASNLGESVNAVNVTFGDSAKGILNLGKNAATELGLSKSEFNGLAVQFSSFASTIAGRGGNVVQTMGDITTRAADFASVMNLDVNEATRLFQSGLAGETEPLRRFGLDLSAAKVESFAYAEGIAKSGETLTENQKVQARYQLLLQQTNKTQGDFANTSESLANQQRILGARWDNMKASLGERLLPAVTAIVSGFTAWLPSLFTIGEQVTNTVVPAVRQMAQWIDANQTPIMIIAGLIAAVFIPHLIALAVRATITRARVIAAWVAMKAQAIASAVVHSAQVVAMVARWAFLGTRALFHAARVALAWFIALGPVAWVIATIIALVALIIANWDTVSKVTTDVWNAVWGFVKDKTSAIADWVSARIDDITGFFGKLGDLPEKVGNWFQGMRDAAEEKLNALVDWASGIPGEIESALGDLGSLLYDAGANILSGLQDGMAAKVGEVKDWFADQLSGIRNMLPFSPAKEGPLAGSGDPFQAGQALVQRLAEGMASGTRLMSDASAGMAGRAGTTAPATIPGAGGVLVENMTVQAWSDRFRFSQVMDELAFHGAI